MQYTQHEEKIRSELKGFWTAVKDVLVNPQGAPFADNEKVRRLAERSALAHGLMCSAYQQLMDAVSTGYRRRDNESMNMALKELGLELSLNLLTNRILVERAAALNKS